MKEQLHLIKLHGCAFGLRDPASGLHLKKSWHIVTSDIRLKDYLDKQCPGGHRHIQISGSLTPFSAGYPLQFCKKVAQYLAPIKWSPVGSHAGQAEGVTGQRADHLRHGPRFGQAADTQCRPECGS